jgi:hypothetical protein
MLDLVCSNCGGWRILQSLRELEDARFCDRCGARSSIEVGKLIPYLFIANAPETVISEQGAVEKTRTETELEEKSRLVMQLDKDILGRTGELRNVEDQIQALNNQLTVLRETEGSLRVMNMRLETSNSEKMVQARELESKLEQLSRREQELQKRNEAPVSNIPAPGNIAESSARVTPETITPGQTTPQVAKCTSCGFDNRQNSTFCGMCGRPIKS